MTIPWEILTAVLAAALVAAFVWGQRRTARLDREHRARLATLVEHLPVMVQAFDAVGRPVVWNRECERVLGVAAADVLGDPQALERLAPDPEDRHRLLGSQGDTQGPPQPRELRLTAADGDTRTVFWTPMSVAMPEWSSWGVGIDVSARQRMEKSRRQLRFAIDNSPEAVFMLGPDGRILDVNQTACRQLEYTHDELLEMTVADLDPLYTLERWPMEWRELKRQRQLVTDSVHRTKSGREIPVEISVGYYESGGKEYCSAFVLDISDRRQTESEKQTISVLSRLFLTAESLEAIFDQVPRILCRRFDFPVAMIELYDTGDEEMVVVGSHGVPATHPEPLRVPAYQTISGTVAKTGRTVVESDALRRSDYRFFLLRKLELRGFVCVPLKIEERVVGTLTLADSRMRELPAGFGDTLQAVANHLAREIERKQAQEALQASEDRWRSLIDNMPDSVSLLDLDGGMLFTNRPLSGRQRDTAPGAPLLAQIPRDRHSQVEQQIAAVKESGATRHCELPIATDDGERWYSCRIGPVHRGDEITALVVVAQDVSDLRRVQAEGRRLEDQLRQAQKMESIGQLAGGVAHDFNNLLVAIQGHAEFARESLSPDSVAYADLERVLEASDRAAGLTRQLLAFSRRQMLQPVDLALNEVLTDLLKILHRVIGEHIRLQLAPGPDLGTVHADRGQIEQVIMNLCVNARDALPGGGMITLETRNVELDAAFCERHHWAREGRYVELLVTDNGAGMDEQTVEQVFEPFFTTKAAGTGTGLGLSTVYGIVKQHEGLIRVESSPGEGTTFGVYLPAVDRPVAEEGENRGLAPRGGSETILLAEDERIVRELVVRILENAGYRVLTAENGAQAVELFAERLDEVDLVVLDLVMPVMGGIETRREILEIDPEARFVFSSGYRSDVPQIRASLGAEVPMVTKPYKREILLDKVRQVLDQEQPVS